MRLFAVLVLLVIAPTVLFSLTIQELDENNDGATDRWIEVTNGATTAVRQDRNFDGKPDYFLTIDEAARKTYEELDFNFDGAMDDFYFFTAGVLERRELDTNYDGRVDLWVYLSEGVYVKKIERDTNFDGEIDFEKTYGGQ